MMSREGNIEYWVQRVFRAKSEAHRILARHEQSQSRVIILENLLRRLAGVPVDVQDYFQEAALCLEQDCRRAAIVMAWAGQFHVFVEKLVELHGSSVRRMRPKWSFKDAAELKETVVESQILDAGKDVGFINRAQLRVLDGQLSIRNQCAHPTLYHPSLNGALGYVDDMLQHTIRYLSL